MLLLGFCPMVLLTSVMWLQIYPRVRNGSIWLPSLWVKPAVEFIAAGLMQVEGVAGHPAQVLDGIMAKVSSSPEPLLTSTDTNQE